ncbi:MAG: hypothetical protein HYY95_10770 [Candidatus Rokubacteria bacterium]|nr:hypothetical protein [Candidatus Rokubacteria bacterium]
MAERARGQPDRRRARVAALRGGDRGHGGPAAGLLLALGGQGIGIVETSAASASPGSRVEIYGSAGWIRADDTFTGAATLQTSAAGGGTFAAPAALAPYAALVADFVRAVRGQRGVGATGDEAAANVAIVEAACARPVLRRSGA